MNNYNTATVSRMEPEDDEDKNDDEDDNDEENYELLSSGELEAKMHSFHSLCLINKINTSNAFEIDMIGPLSMWLMRKRKTDSVKLFQELGDFLETSGKIYGYRIDSLSESTSKLIEQFRIINYKDSLLNEDNDNTPKEIHKPKRLRLMLTTSEKLNCKSIITRNSVDENKYQGNFKIDFDKLFETTGRPANYMLSLYSNISLAEEIKKLNINNMENNNENIYSMNDVQNEIVKRVLCPEFNNFIANKDKIIDSEEPLLDGIEDRFYPNDNSYMNSMSDPDGENYEEVGSNNIPTSNGLLECIDEVSRDYSFFNPILLANWKGPKLWKTQAMAKALKSSSQWKQHDYFENMDDLSQETTTEPKTMMECNKKNKLKIKWLTMSQIDTFIRKNIRSNEKLAPRTLQKWTTLTNICDTKSIVVNPTYKLSLLEYIKIKPDWWIKEFSTNNKLIATQKSPGSSLSNEYIDDNYQGIFNTQKISDALPKDYFISQNDAITNKGTMPNGMEELKIKNCELISFNKFNESCSEDDDDMLNGYKTESIMDIGELKKEIYNIIDQECIKIDSMDEWSSRLSFLNLLVKLRVLEREEFTTDMVFVSLLHLANEKGLKLFQEYGTIRDLKEIYIARPINNQT